MVVEVFIGPFWPFREAIPIPVAARLRRWAGDAFAFTWDVNQNCQVQKTWETDGFSLQICICQSNLKKAFDKISIQPLGKSNQEVFVEYAYLCL